jgi:hypothetical protein
MKYLARMMLQGDQTLIPDGDYLRIEKELGDWVVIDANEHLAGSLRRDQMRFRVQGQGPAVGVLSIPTRQTLRNSFRRPARTTLHTPKRRRRTTDFSLVRKITRDVGIRWWAPYHEEWRNL